VDADHRIQQVVASQKRVPELGPCGYPEGDFEHKYIPTLGRAHHARWLAEIPALSSSSNLVGATVQKVECVYPCPYA
jgi:hypothetical protein